MFITREAEKQKKKEAKEAAKHLKIWDKKTATSRMPLKRIKDEDIKPLQSDENVYNFNASYLRNAFDQNRCIGFDAPGGTSPAAD